MSNEVGILFDKAQRLAKATQLGAIGLERITDEDRGWIYKFLKNEITDPGSKRLEGFIRDINKHNEKSRRK